MKYKIIKSDLFINGKLIPENSEIELSDSEIKGIEDYLVKCHPELACLPLGTVEGSLNNKKEIESKKRGNK
jgi:hypothetical protein